MRAIAVLVLLAVWLWPTSAVDPVCCDDLAGGATPAACDLYCEWNGVNFSHNLYISYLED